jgi:hypothetical protein
MKPQFYVLLVTFITIILMMTVVGSSRWRQREPFMLGLPFAPAPAPAQTRIIAPDDATIKLSFLKGDGTFNDVLVAKPTGDMSINGSMDVSGDFSNSGTAVFGGKLITKGEVNIGGSIISGKNICIGDTCFDKDDWKYFQRRPKSLQGSQGPSGLLGIKGADGTPGTKGTDGVPGARGQNGAPGDAGTPGSKGPDGVGISSVSGSIANGKGTLVITFTNNTTTKIPADQFVGGKVLSNVEVVSGTTLKLTFYDGSTQSVTLAIPQQNNNQPVTPGPPGPQGLQGAKGETGLQGIQGAKGDTGAPGAKGDIGSVGAPAAFPSDALTLSNRLCVGNNCLTPDDMAKMKTLLQRPVQQPVQQPQGLYSFTTFKFTPCGAIGRTGPTLAQCQTAYSAVAWAQNTQFFNMTTQGIQLWTVPVTGNYIFVCAGAQGGGRLKGTGIIIQATLALTQGTILKILVGQSGVVGTANADTGGGGGATFIATGNNQPVLVAGGGGGSGDRGQDAGSTINGIYTQGVDRAGVPTPFGSGGASFTNNSVSKTHDNLFTAANSFLNGGIGGAGGRAGGWSGGGDGGFGGGGGACCCATGHGGGAGGYQGGDAIATSGYNTGSGGYCYYAGTYITTSSVSNIGTNAGDGYITITLTNPPITNNTTPKTITYTASFTSGQPPSNQAVNDWKTFKSQLQSYNGNVFTTVQLYGSKDPNGKKSANPTVTQGIYNAIKNGTNYTGNDGNNIWSYCGSRDELWINPPSECNGNNCPNPGYILRPLQSNDNWGGINTPTCSPPSQTMTLTFS